MTGGGANKPQRVLVAGASGTIGRAVMKELKTRRIAATGLLRPGHPNAVRENLRTADFADPVSMASVVNQVQPDTVISCIASRNGSPKDAHAVDYQANANLLAAAQAAGASHFILLSAICVQRPRLAFQHAKLAFEAELTAADIDHTIIRPTAFFKSLAGQVERVAKGGKFLIFGDGKLTRCKPISDRDLARFIADSVIDPVRRGQTLPIGGPGPAISPRDQLDILIDLLGDERQTRRVPLWIFGLAERVLGLGARLSDWCAEKAEYARIARYYATESMLALDPATGEYSADLTPEFGEDLLSDHYEELLGGAR